MNKTDIQKCRDTPILGVAEQLGLKVSKLRCICPFHADKSPSLSFSITRNSYRCWSCDARGDPIDLVRNYLHKSFTDACKWLANENNIIIEKYNPKEHETMSTSKPFEASRFQRFFERPYINAEANRFLYDERKLNPYVIRWCRLTSWTDRGGISWLQIPYYSIDGQLIGVQNRRLTESDTLPRFRFPQGCKPMIYNLPMLKALVEGDELWISEGVTDCLAILSSGRKCIAIPSATLLTPLNKELLAVAPTRNWHIAPDQDAAGERLYQALLATANECGATLTRHQLPEGYKDISDWWKSINH